MKKFLNKALCLIFALVIVCLVVGCSPTAANNKIKLATPEVTIGYDGVALWDKDDNAIYYIYKINGESERLVDGTHVQLEDNQSIEVKAVGISDEYLDSDFSKPQKYVKGDTPNTHTKHSDIDEDGICCICGASVMAEISFYSINDLHGKFMDTDNQPGVDEFTTYMKNLYKDSSRAEVLLSSGDMWQGTVESSTNKGQLMTEWMNELGFSAMALGNHEYDWGAEVLLPNSKLAKFPFLAINVRQNGLPVDYCKPSTIVEAAGVKIGVIGAIGDCLSSISGDHTQGLEFATGRELSNLVQNEAERLRRDEQCDFIVYSIHDGYGGSYSTSSVKSVSDYEISNYYDINLSNTAVDLVFEGHTHQSYILKDSKGVYHLQGGGENHYVSAADLSFNTVTGKFTIKPRLVSSYVYAENSLTDDPCVDEIFNKYFADNNPYTTILGSNSKEKYDYEICTKVAELYYQFGQKTWGSKYQIVFGGGFLKLRSPYRLPSGNITYADIFSILPFDNDVVLGKIRGSDLKSRFLNASSENYYKYAKISSADILDSKYYYIVVDSYTSTYKSNRITEVERATGGMYARDLLAEFIASGGWR